MDRDFLTALTERVLVFDGAMGTMLHAAELTLDDYQGNEGCSEILCVTRPDVVQGIHAAYLEAGADVVETNSFGASAIVLGEYDMADRVVELNQVAARLAREVVDGFQADGRPRWVAGSMGPGTKLPTLLHTTYEHLRYLAQHARTPLSCQPNAGLPELREGRPHYPLSPGELAQAHDRFVAEFGVNVVGGCCGTTPEHIRQVVEAVGGRQAAHRETVHDAAVGSLYQSVPLDQDTTYLTIGERCNANGSRKFRDLMLAGDLDGLVGIAKEQIREGAHVLDVCVDYVGRDGVPDMDALVERLAQQSTAPIMLDSTQADVIEA